MAVHSLVLRVFYQMLCLTGILGACILPAIGVLQLEVRIASEFPDGKAHTVVLTDITIAPYPRAVLCKQSFVMLLGNHIDNASDGIRAIERTGGTLHNLDLLDVVRIDEIQVVLTTHVSMNALTVNKDQDIVVTKSVELHLRSHIVLVEGKRCRKTCEDILQTPTAIVAEHLGRNHLRLHRSVLQQVLGTSACHNHLLKTVRTPDIRLCRYTDSNQPKAKSPFLSSIHI